MFPSSIEKDAYFNIDYRHTKKYNLAPPTPPHPTTTVIALKKRQTKKEIPAFLFFSMGADDDGSEGDVRQMVHLELSSVPSQRRAPSANTSLALRLGKSILVVLVYTQEGGYSRQRLTLASLLACSSEPYALPSSQQPLFLKNCSKARQL